MRKSGGMPTQHLHFLPLDGFLMIHHIADLQVSLLAGSMVVFPKSPCSAAQVVRWYDNYRSGDFERAEVIKLELNAQFLRAALEEMRYLRLPGHNVARCHRRISGTSSRWRGMFWKTLKKPLGNVDLTGVTGLHEN